MIHPRPSPLLSLLMLCGWSLTGCGGADSATSAPVDAIADSAAASDAESDVPEALDSGDAGPADQSTQDTLPSIAACPGSPLMGYGSCTGSFTCEYGKECCCETCEPSVRCWCSAGVFSCGYTDHCFMAHDKCSPGCQLGKFQTPAGCATCAASQPELQTAVDAVVAPLKSCEEDEDCTAFAPFQNCGLSCAVGLAKDATGTASAALSSVVAGWCAIAAVCPPGCETGAPRCIQGKCKLAQPCDPLYQPLGTACDDGNPCTLNDQCTGPGQCTGVGDACDDNNPCTQDYCDTASGCTHAATAGPCDTEVACSLGGLCAEGQCQDAGLTGKATTIATPNGYPSSGRSLLALTDGTYVVTHNQSAASGVRVLHVTKSGAVQWALELGTNTTDGVVAQLPGGGLAIAALTAAFTNQQGARVWFVSKAGKVEQTIDLSATMPTSLHIAARPEGGVVVGGGEQSAPNVWAAWVARVDAQGKVLGKTTLGGLPGFGGGVFVAASTGTTGVLLPAASAADMLGQAMEDARFVRLDQNGAVATDVLIAATPGRDLPTGLLAADGGWIAGVGQMAYDKDSKTPGGLFLRLGLDGAVVWNKSGAEFAAPLQWSGANIFVPGLKNSGMANALLVAQTFTPDGLAVSTLEVPVSLLFSSGGSEADWAPAVGSGAVAVGGSPPGELVWVSVSDQPGCP